MDSRFSFFSTAHAELLNDVLARRNPALVEKVRQNGTVSRSDAVEIMAAISEEFTNNLGEDWEPTKRGLFVSDLTDQFNAARVSEWPQ